MIVVVLQGKAMNEQQEVPGVVPSATSFSHLHDRSTLEPRCRREKSCGQLGWKEPEVPMLSCLIVFRGLCELVSCRSERLESAGFGFSFRSTLQLR